MFKKGIISRGLNDTADVTSTGKESAEYKLKYLCSKGIYSYEYVDSHQRFSETVLPPKEAFYSQITRNHIKEDEYKHAQNVCNTFGCKTFRDYHDIYLKTDVLLLADVFKKFRDSSIHHYSLDPAHYFSSPGMFWDALLKMTKVTLELFTDINTYLFIEKGLLGGLSMVLKKICLRQ